MTDDQSKTGEPPKTDPKTGDDGDVGGINLDNIVGSDSQDKAADVDLPLGEDLFVEDKEPVEFDSVVTLQAECDDLKDQLLRAKAEVENMRRRTERELSQSRKYGHANFARDLLSAFDNLKRAIDVLPQDRGNFDDIVANFVAGVELINQDLTAVLARHGVTAVDPAGEKFDHDRHQAMFEIPSNDVEPGTIMQVAQRGWVLHDRLLTPAMVGVAKAVDGANGGTGEGEN